MESEAAEEARIFLEDTDGLDEIPDADILYPDAFAERQRCKDMLEG